MTKPQLKFVTFVQTFPVAADGIHIVYHKRGDTVELPANVADGLIRDKIAVPGRADERKLPHPALAPAVERIDLRGLSTGDDNQPPEPEKKPEPPLIAKTEPPKE